MKAKRIAQEVPAITAQDASLPVGTVCSLYMPSSELHGMAATISHPYGLYEVRDVGERYGYLVEFNGKPSFVTAGQIIAKAAPKRYSHLRLVVNQ